MQTWVPACAGTTCVRACVRAVVVVMVMVVMVMVMVMEYGS